MNKLKTEKRLITKLSPIYFFSLVSWGVVAHSTINPSVTDGPTVSVGANGSTIVNINTAGKGGVSHNIYTQFDVDKGGVILNNSAVASASNLAGNIAGNINLTGGAAAIILNEVDSSKASQLSGMIEVAGQKAQVIVANPSGITCSGCGFTNTERATLTTGKARVTDGTLLGYTVGKGTITINGNGLNTESANYTDVISRAVQVSTNIYAKDLKITAGRNNVNADNTQVEELAPAGVAPLVSIDVARLGGMYANKITLISTDRGVGVRNGGTIDATVDNVSITVDGILENKWSLSAKNNININTTRGLNYGYTAGYALNNSANGAIKAGNIVNIDLAKSSLTNSGGILQSAGDINIISGDIVSIYGKIHSQGALSIGNSPYYNNYGGTLNNNGGAIIGEGGVTISSDTLDNSSGLIVAGAGNVDIYTARNTLNNTDGIINANGKVKLDVGYVINTEGLIQSSDNVSVNTNKGILNNGKGIIRGSHDVSISSGSLENMFGQISANNHLDINTNGYAISNNDLSRSTEGAGLFSGNGGMKLTASAINNSNGRIVSDGNIVVNVASSSNNIKGTIASGHDIIMTTHTLNNNQGTIKSANNNVINTNSLSNKSGEIDAEGLAELTIANSYSNDGNMSGKQGININAKKGVVNNYGTLSSVNGLTTINSRSFYNYEAAVVDSPAGVHIELYNPDNFNNSGIINGPISITSN